MSLDYIVVEFQSPPVAQAVFNRVVRSAPWRRRAVPHSGRWRSLLSFD